MNGVLGALELLRQTELDIRQRRLVKTAAASGESLMDILNDVLDHSKIEAGKLVLSATPMSLHSVAAAATALFRANAESRGLNITLLTGPNVPDGVVGDAPRIKQVLLNLLGNGVKFTERGGVTLSLAVQPPALGQADNAVCVRFAVADSGIGIPAAALDEVFQPFHQVDSTRSRLRGGTGLGLAISQRIIQAMGGRIEVESRLGSGSVFRFDLVLPLAPHVPPPSHDSEFGALDTAGQMSGVVLLVEDNIVNRMIGAEMLKSYGVDVMEAEDGAQALALLQSQRVDLVLMDIQMPVLDGYGATRALRDREARLRLPRVPIVALTANAFDDDAVQSLAAGMDGHLAKPYSRLQLGELLTRWL
jgi:CheY-like chemotaxis protein